MKTNLAKHGGFALLFGIAWASMLSFSCGGGGEHPCPQLNRCQST